jgi:hypothetical protein
VQKVSHQPGFDLANQKGNIAPANAVRSKMQTIGETSPKKEALVSQPIVEKHQRS